MAKRSKRSVSDAAKARQAKSKELAKKYRSEAAILKEQGVLSNRVNARKNISRATRTKINKFRDVLEGKFVVVKRTKALPPKRYKQIRDEYRAKGMFAEPNGLIQERGSLLLVPKPYERMKAQLERSGKVRVTRHLKNGREEYVIFPYNPHDLPDLVETLQTDPTINGLKQPDEHFSFRLNGHNARFSFTTAQQMADYMQRYNPDNVVTLTFQRFYIDGWPANERNPFEGDEPKLYSPRADPSYGRYGREDRNARRRVSKFTRSKDAARKAAARKAETPEQKAERQRKDRERQKARRKQQ